MQHTDDSSPRTEPTLNRAFDALVEVLNQNQVRYAIVGGLAMIQHHIKVRVTNHTTGQSGGMCGGIAGDLLPPRRPVIV